MFTSDNEISRTRLLKNARGYFIAAVSVALFGAIYELFSYGVYSAYMIFAFVIPLLLGALPAILLSMRYRAILPPPAARMVWRAGIATLTVGSLFAGVIEIYGTDSALAAVYGIFGAAMLIIAAVLALYKK